MATSSPGFRALRFGMCPSEHLSLTPLKRSEELLGLSSWGWRGVRAAQLLEAFYASRFGQMFPELHVDAWMLQRPARVTRCRYDALSLPSWFADG